MVKIGSSVSFTYRYTVRLLTEIGFRSAKFTSSTKYDFGKTVECLCDGCRDMPRHSVLRGAFCPFETSGT